MDLELLNEIEDTDERNKLLDVIGTNNFEYSLKNALSTQEKNKQIQKWRAVYYIADFVYKDKQGNTVVEDTKGVKTPDYTIKRKLMLWIHKIRITEVTE